jgi:hypothetical protein
VEGKSTPRVEICTLYVADVGGIPTLPTIVRVFVPSHGWLVRQDVIGSGEIDGSTNGEDIATYQSADGSVPPRDLAISLAGGTVDSMTLGPESSGKLNAEGRDGGATMPLTLLNASAVRGMPAAVLPGAVQYVGASRVSTSGARRENDGVDYRHEAVARRG